LNNKNTHLIANVQIQLDIISPSRIYCKQRKGYVKDLNIYYSVFIGCDENQSFFHCISMGLLTRLCMGAELIFTTAQIHQRMSDAGLEYSTVTDNVIFRYAGRIRARIGQIS
jgi:hypothetical protein